MLSCQSQCGGPPSLLPTRIYPHSHPSSINTLVPFSPFICPFIVVFLFQLSDSFGGVHISPSKIYTPGVTIKSFAKELYDRLMVENPTVLIERLGRFDVMGGPSHDEESGAVGDDGEEDEEEEEYEGEKVTSTD